MQIENKKMSMRYCRVLSHHPLIESVPGRDSIAARSVLRGYPDDAPSELRPIAIRALISSVLSAGDADISDDAGELDCRKRVREFYEFRRRVLRHACRVAPASVDTNTPAVAVAFWRVLQADPSRRIDAHLDALVEFWLDEHVAIDTDEELSFGVPAADRRSWLIRHYAVAALLSFDWALLARANHRYDEAMNAAAFAAQSARASFDLEPRGHVLVGDGVLEQVLAEHRSKSARKAAIARHRNSAVGKAKFAVYRQWRHWTRGEGKPFRSIAAFARWAVAEHSNIQSTQTVEQWVRAWRKGDVPEFE
ncbi:hypothetical protein G5C41_02310 [Burkholderia pseudomallei]|uniref:hypothetical protein n=2 Tax=Burkholderia pseudomallei TaxID=28450 RepID=UPI0011C4E3E5|nr:hypothetical protein [Burkholderia pseudomallei]MBD2936258.1 hypothetical protein [Burkholderia pseudomallei]MBD2960089.1 hypothetical protein [Burkholderia pseudomallei]